ncbi:hypothetical protein [Streptomyces sp. BA2]|uniref:hypothetical protein n=1 Tax=Streptomyces sp. BA2 TaxID=436595 RepID=UPI001326167A|nr:hypothetical protein [Streptomyces sp. BA2]MWA09194.1 hypothetical protein [Streptomyces sp. BA2]
MSEAHLVDRYAALYEDFAGRRALVCEAGCSGGRSAAGEHGLRRSVAGEHDLGQGGTPYEAASIPAAPGDLHV